MRQFRCQTVRSEFHNNRFVMLDDQGRHRATLFTDHAHRPVFCLQGEDANEQIVLETTENDEPEVFVSVVPNGMRGEVWLRLIVAKDGKVTVSLGGHDGIPHVEVRGDEGVLYESPPISARQAND